MAITKFTRPTLDLLTADVMHAIAQVAQKHGIDVQKGRGTFGDNNFTMKLEFSVMGDDGKAVTRESADFKRYADAYGLDADDLGKVFRVSGHDYRIVGLSTKAKKYPILADRTNGDGTYKFPADTVKLALSKGSSRFISSRGLAK